jgi:hypothetical protein
MKQNYLLALSALVVMASFAAATALADDAYPLSWVRQLGTTSDDFSHSVAADAFGNVYISGRTEGSLGGPYAGPWCDAFLAKYDVSGNLLWTRQLGTVSGDESWSVAAAGNGDVYISGYTFGSLGGPQAGGGDAFIARYSASGNILWTRQIGTTAEEWSYSTAVDGSGNAYITGHTHGSLGGPNAGIDDAFLVKYDALGNVVWTRQTGTSAWDEGTSVAVDVSGNAYISGHTTGNLGGPNAGGWDAFLVKYDNSGNLLWTRQIGTSQNEESWSVAVDGSGNAYITGWTAGSLGGPNAGSRDVFLAKYDASGNLLWTRQFGTAGVESSYSVAVDGFGNPFISGWAGPDAFLAKYNASGNLLWTTSLGFGNNDYEVSRSVAVDALGNAYISGWTDGDLYGSNAGGKDAFLAKYIVPEPSALAMLALGAFGIFARLRSRG